MCVLLQNVQLCLYTKDFSIASLLIEKIDQIHTNIGFRGHKILVMLSKLDTDLIRHACNALHARDRRKTRIFKFFVFDITISTISIYHDFDRLGTVHTVCMSCALMISDTSQLVSNITLTHIKSPGTFKMITPIPDENQHDKMSIFSNICCVRIRHVIPRFFETYWCFGCGIC